MVIYILKNEIFIEISLPNFFICFNYYYKIKAKMEKNVNNDLNIKQIGNYLLKRTLGIGHFCIVKLGIHITKGITVAVKIIDIEKLNKSEISRILREIEILKTLNHPNIIKFKEVISTNKHIYIIMEYIDDNLSNYVLRKRLLSEKKAHHFFCQLISSVEYLHLLGISHRDIKPENILLDTKNYNIKLIDFDLSHISKNNSDLLKTRCGSPCFIPPEIIQGHFYKGESSDIWSCGIVLYFMLTGIVPFEADSINVLFMKIVSGVFNIPSFISNDAIDLLKQMIKVDPCKRISIKNIKMHPFYLGKVSVERNYITEPNSEYRKIKKKKPNLSAVSSRVKLIKNMKINADLKQKIHEKLKDFFINKTHNQLKKCSNNDLIGLRKIKVIKNKSRRKKIVKKNLVINTFHINNLSKNKHRIIENIKPYKKNNNNIYFKWNTQKNSNIFITKRFNTEKFYIPPYKNLKKNKKKFYSSPKENRTSNPKKKLFTSKNIYLTTENSNSENEPTSPKQYISSPKKCITLRSESKPKFKKNIFNLSKYSKKEYYNKLDNKRIMCSDEPMNNISSLADNKKKFGNFHKKFKSLNNRSQFKLIKDNKMLLSLKKINENILFKNLLLTKNEDSEKRFISIKHLLSNKKCNTEYYFDTL